MGKINKYIVFIDGIDKAGKDLVASYVDYLSNRKYIAKARGIISQVAFSKLYNRNYDYLLDPNNSIQVYLTVDKPDWQIRCKLNNEPSIDYETNLEAFNKAKNFIKNSGYTVLEFNTSEETAFSIANKIVSFMDSLNK